MSRASRNVPDPGMLLAPRHERRLLLNDRVLGERGDVWRRSSVSAIHGAFGPSAPRGATTQRSAPVAVWRKISGRPLARRRGVSSRAMLRQLEPARAARHVAARCPTWRSAGSVGPPHGFREQLPQPSFHFSQAAAQQRLDFLLPLETLPLALLARGSCSRAGISSRVSHMFGWSIPGPSAREEIDDLGRCVRIPGSLVSSSSMGVGILGPPGSRQRAFTDDAPLGGNWPHRRARRDPPAGSRRALGRQPVDISDRQGRARQPKARRGRCKPGRGLVRWTAPNWAGPRFAGECSRTDRTEPTLQSRLFLRQVARTA